MTKNTGLFFILTILCTFCFCGKGKKTIESSRILYFAVFPHATTEGTYVFELNNDMKIHVQEGTRRVETNNGVRFEVLEKERTIELSIESFKKIMDIVKTIEKCGDMILEGDITDSIEVILITKSNHMHRYLFSFTECDKKLISLYALFNLIYPMKRYGDG